MSTHCTVCDDAGTLRDGSVCPSCNVTRWRAWGHESEIVRPKRQAWVRPSSAPIERAKPVSAKPAIKAG